MFNEYFELGNRLQKHYLSPSVFLCLATGQFVPPIHRRNLYSLQYSMLPATRTGIVELWKKLTEREPIPDSKFNGMNGYPSLPRRAVANGGPRRGSRN
jgi:phosphatidylinositol N-acetylglucosaminyltransferase subunit Q